MYFKSLTLAALLVLQCTTSATASVLGSRNMIEIVHGNGDADTIPTLPYSANYHSVFARDSDPEPAFELVPISIKDKLISLKRRGSADACEQEYTVKRGETCHDVANKFGIHLDDFYYWNPQINSRCKNMKAGRRYCVKNSDAGAEPEACAVRHKVVKGDTCASVAKQYGITKGEFFKLNSQLSTSCSNLDIGYSYCIAPAATNSSKHVGAQKEAAPKKVHEEENKQEAKADAAKEAEEKKQEAAAAAAAAKKAEEEKEEAAAAAAAAAKKSEEEKEAAEAAAAAKKAEEEKEAAEAAAAAKATEEKEENEKKISKSVTNFSSKTRPENSSSEKRKVIQSNIPMTYYWIAMPQDYNQGGKRVQIKSCSGKVLGTTSVEYADALVMEGTGILGDKIVNLGSCGCTNYNCFMELDKHEDPFGLTSYSTPLRPFVTVAANDLPRGTKIYVPQLDGWKLPGGKTHNGCLLVEDKGWSFSSHHIDFYVYAMDNYETLNREHRISKIDVYEGGSCNLIEYM